MDAALRLNPHLLLLNVLRTHPRWQAFFSFRLHLGSTFWICRCSGDGRCSHIFRLYTEDRNFLLPTYFICSTRALVIEIPHKVVCLYLQFVNMILF